MIGNLNRQKEDERKSRHIFFRGFIAVVFLIILRILLFGLSLNLNLNPVNLMCWADDPGGAVRYAVPDTRYADPNTGIKNIIQQVPAGGTVFVRKGHYQEGTISLRKEGSLKGVSLIGVGDDLGDVVISGDSDGVVIEAASHTTIKNLVIRDGEIGINCRPGDVEGSMSGPSTDITIDHNLIIKNANGILIGSDEVNLTNNTIVHNAEGGIIVYVKPNGPVFRGEGNIIAFNGPYGGIEFIQQDESDLELTAFLELTTIFLGYNDIYDALYHTWLDMNSIPRDQIPLLSLEVLGPGNFSANPCFADAEGEDYHLLSYSPCIDRGDPNSDYSHEVNDAHDVNEPLPNGGRVNLGFYGNTSQAAPSIDSDHDGLYDYQEGNEDLDEDGYSDWQDADTATIPLPLGMDKISLHLQLQDISQDANQGMQFKDVQAVIPSDLNLDSPAGILPFNAIQFRVPNLDEGATICITMHFPQSFQALETSQYLALSSDGLSWQSLPLIIDPNGQAISFTIEDGQTGDKDGIRDGTIEHLAALVIPETITWENPKNCFISLVNPFSDDASLHNYHAQNHKHNYHAQNRKNRHISFFKVRLQNSPAIKDSGVKS